MRVRERFKKQKAGEGRETGREWDRGKRAEESERTHGEDGKIHRKRWRLRKRENA